MESNVITRALREAGCIRVPAETARDLDRIRGWFGRAPYHVALGCVLRSLRQFGDWDMIPEDLPVAPSGGESRTIRVPLGDEGWADLEHFAERWSSPRAAAAVATAVALYLHLVEQYAVDHGSLALLALPESVRLLPNEA